MEPPSDPSSSSGRSISPLPPLAPLQNPKYRHISRSAAKRESVQLLGSIKDLQLHFSRAGLIEHRPGSGVGVRGLGGITEGDEENYPPASAGRARDTDKRDKERRPWKDVELPRIDPASARREVRSLIGNVRNLWDIGLPSSPSTGLSNPNSPLSPTSTRPETRETKSILVNTAQAIRRVRFLALLISHTTKGRRASGPVMSTPKPSKSRLAFSTPSRPSGGLPRAVSYNTSGSNERKSSLGPLSGEIKEDGLGELRKAALDVLAGLRVLEERLRLHSTYESGQLQALPISVSPRELERALSPGEDSISSINETESTGPTSDSTIFTEPDVYDSEEEDYNLNALAQSQGDNEHLTTWEERLLVEGREYRDMGEEEIVESVKEGVKKWIGVVEGLFGVKEGVSSREVEEWARAESWEGNPMGRLHAFLAAHLPVHLQLTLPPPDGADMRTELLIRLSDGFILAQAFNTALASSPRVWGFIPEEDIHDTLRVPDLDASITPEGEEVRAEREWTFRRVGNLTCWAAALRLRYNLPIHIPSKSHLVVPNSIPPRTSYLSPSNSPSPGSSPVLGAQSGKTTAVKRRENAPRIDFDPMKVAKREEEWEATLGGLSTLWVEEAAREMREVIAEADAGP